MSEIEKPAKPEYRHAVNEMVTRAVPLRGLEFRDASATGDGSYTFTGYAAVFDQETVLYDGSWWRLREVIAPDAFNRVLGEKPDVHMNIGHDMNRAIARTGIDGVGELELSADGKGLRVFARLDPLDPDVVALAAKMSRGIVDQMSFAFTIAKATYQSTIDEENDFEDELRTIDEIGQLYDVCACAQGAYPQTEAELAMRTLFTLGRAGIDPAGLLEHRSPRREGADPVAPEAREDEPGPAEERTPDDDVAELEAGGQTTRSRRAAAMRMRIAIDN